MRGGPRERGNGIFRHDAPGDGYRGVVEDSVYVAPGARGSGVGRALMLALLDEARRARLHTVVTAIGLPNDASVALHASLGFGTRACCARSD